MPPSTASLKVDVRVVRPRFTVEATFEVPPGITILFGPSGAGKSTLLSAIAGLTQPSFGRIALGDEVWFDGQTGRERPIDERQIAYVFQSLALFPHMTAVDNVAYGVSRALARPERRKRAEEMLERMHVAHLRDRHPPTFSGGEAQRVALARAFARSPRLVLLDEPFSAMHRELRNELALELRAFVEEAQVPALHVTHHRNEARALGRHVLMLEGGKLKGAGPLGELLPEE
jgi:molybdate transport system ATP-binding protein